MIRYCGRCGVAKGWHGTIKLAGIPDHEFTVTGPPYPDRPPLVEIFVPARLRRLLRMKDRRRNYR
jgi:hypothetical protein